MSKKEIANLEAISDFYRNGDRMDELLVDREVELIAKIIDRPGRAVEIGCGNGYSTERLLKLFPGLKVVEPSRKNVALMKRRIGREIDCQSCLLEELDIQQKFDQVIFLNVIEHVEDPVASLRSIERLLTDEGQVFISAPNCMSLNRRAGYRMGLLGSYAALAPKDYALGHRRVYTVEMMLEHIEAAGLKCSQMKGVYLKPLPESQMVALGESVVQAFYSLGEDVPEYCANLLAVARKKYY